MFTHCHLDHAYGVIRHREEIQSSRVAIFAQEEGALVLEAGDPHQTVAEMYGREIEPVPVDGTTRVEVCFAYEDALCMSGPAPRPT